MRTALRGALWFGLYVAVVLVPLIFATIGVVDDDRGFWREFTVALGSPACRCWVCSSCWSPR